MCLGLAPGYIRKGDCNGCMGAAFGDCDECSGNIKTTINTKDEEDMKESE